MKHKNLMIVGTSSGAGKSITVAGLCRILKKMDIPYVLLNLKIWH